jgi:hypothetical protein
MLDHPTTSRLGARIKRLFTDRSAADMSDDDGVDANRRATLAAASMASGVLVAYAANPAAASPTPPRPGNSTSLPLPARLVAPRDCYILQVHVSTGALVADGADIATLDGDEEVRALRQIELAARLMELQKNSASKPQTDIRQAILRSTLDVATAYLTYATKMHDFRQSQYQLGVRGVTQEDVQSWVYPMARGTAEVDRATKALGLFNFNVDIVTKKLALMTEAIASEKVAVQERQRKLVIRSPRSGNVVLHCFPGAFLSKGDVLAEIK